MRFVDFASPIIDQQGQLRAVLATHVLWNWVGDINAVGARIFAEKLCVTVAESPMPVVGRITISLGIAECLEEDSGELDAVSRADQALYRAKSGGRNRVAS